MPHARLRTAAFGPRSAALAPLLWGALQLGGCVCPPTLEEWAEVGFRTPEATLRSFQLAVRADAPRVEYRCLSVGLRRGLSQLAWREAREEWYSENPFLRSGIAKADVERSERLGPRRHRFVVASYGHRFEVALVREDFYQVYREGELVEDELLPGGRPFSDYAQVVEDGDQRALVAGTPPLLVPLAPSEGISEFRVGQEWKVDGFRPLEGDQVPAPSPSP